MHNRRIYETIGLRHDDIATDPIVTAVRDMLVNHDDIDQQQVLIICDLWAVLRRLFHLYVHQAVDWQTYHRVKQDALLKIAGTEQHGAQIAFPTQTLHVQPEPGRASQLMDLSLLPFANGVPDEVSRGFSKAELT